MPITRISLFGVAVAFGTGTCAAAQPPARHWGQSFISPMGEPFHAGERGGDPLTDWFNQADANHDGFLTTDEMIADAARFFGTLDTNHDGEIDPDEIEHYEDAIAIRSGDDEARAGRYGLLQIPEPVISADSDFNRGVSAAEFRKAARQRFTALDVNHTGRLTLPELQGIHAAASSASRHAPRDQSQDEGPPLDPDGDTSGPPYP